jgi:transposase
VRVPSIDEEDLRRSHRERSRLVRERTAHINRIKGLLFGQGIRGINVKSQYKTLAVDKLLTGDGHRLPPRLACEIGREIQRLAMVQEQIAEIEREPGGRPRGITAGRAMALAIKEAYRLVTVREGDKVLKLPAIQGRIP